MSSTGRCAGLPAIDLRCCSAAELIASVDPGSVSGIHADPPWMYAQSSRGAASDEYPGMSESEIADTLSRALVACRDDAYLAVWCCWPKLMEWLPEAGRMPWRYLTGGAWCKSTGFGVGFHAAGDSEFWLLYGKGSPKPADGRQTNGITAPRIGHSEKPQAALEALVRTLAPVGGLILDPFAGESASLARCCARLGRRYVGAEIDPDRHERAMWRLAGESRAQTAMAGQGRLL